MYQCTTCGKAFGRLGNLQRHERNLHSNTTSRATDQQSATSSDATHRPCFSEIVDDDTVFEHGCEVLECDACEMYFLSQEELEKHEKVYTLCIHVIAKNSIKKSYFVEIETPLSYLAFGVIVAKIPPCNGACYSAAVIERTNLTRNHWYIVTFRGSGIHLTLYHRHSQTSNISSGKGSP